MKILTLLLAITLASCATTATVAVLPIPERPVLPSIPESELTCISDDAYRALVLRDKLWSGHVDTLENIIRSTH